MILTICAFVRDVLLSGISVTRITVSGLVLAPFPVYSFALTLHPLSSLPLDSQYTLFLVPGAVAQLGPSHGVFFDWQKEVDIGPLVMHMLTA
jgi:hypothetical protein